MCLAGKYLKMSFRTDPHQLEKIEIWTSKETIVTPFMDVTDKALQSQRVGWYQPMMWNEKAYDALFRVSDHELRVVQITDKSDTRTFDLSAVIPLAKAMKVHVIDVVHVCRSKNFETLKVKEKTKGKPRQALTKVLQEIYDAKMGTKKGRKKRGSELPEPNITFRTLCYQLGE